MGATQKRSQKRKDKEPAPHYLQAVPLKATPVHLPVELIIIVIAFGVGHFGYGKFTFQ